MNYQQTCDWMFSRLPFFQQKGAPALNAKLDAIIEFCSYLQHPEKRFKSIHVAGTNGKGSSSHMLASVLQEAGYKVGLYTSPHLRDFRERIKINGAEISQQEVIDFIQAHKSYIESHKISFFELTVAMAFDYFAAQKVDMAIIEVGLGGRLDATNIITPEVSLITNIGKDHTQFLGTQIKDIAREKAGIIKPYVPVVISEYNDHSMEVFAQVAKDNFAPLYLAKPNQKKTDLKGNYQEKNTAGVVEVIRHLKDFKISEESIDMGLLNVVANTGLKGRWQTLQENPKVIADTAHNKEGLTYTMKQLQEEVKNNQHKSLRIVFGVVADKDIDGIFELLPKTAVYYLAEPKNERALKKELLFEKFTKQQLDARVCESIPMALAQAIDDSDFEDLIYVGGSNFVVAEVI